MSEDRIRESMAAKEVVPLSEQNVMRVVAKMLFPFILVFAIYVISHGELGPGGGFQGGVIAAAAFIMYGLVFGVDELTARVSPRVLEIMMAVGVLLYAGVGLQNLLAGSNFLDYTIMGDAPGATEGLGMTLVEWGVGITVTTVFVTIYINLTERRFLLQKRENAEVGD